MIFSMRANGKLLLTGEYFVMDGAVALALPTQLGQKLEVTALENESPHLHWQSFNADGSLWFEAKYAIPSLEAIELPKEAQAQETALRLQEILIEIRSLNAHFLAKKEAILAKTTLEFDRNWGLGSSSTLITLLSKWANIDPFILLENTFGGSGYDLAAATATQPILFQKLNGKNRWDNSRFAPTFKENLYFVYLGKKQSSKEALVHYMVTPADDRSAPLQRISQITHNVAAYAPSLEEFETLLEEHEGLVHEVIKHPKAKEKHFADFWGKIKSLGAWGGDFILATSNKDIETTKAYFKDKGFDTVLAYDELILHN